MPTPKITVYSKPVGCYACTNTTRRLDEKGLDYDYVDITAEENADKLADLTSRGLRQAPVVHVGDDPMPVQGEGPNTWSGFRPDLIDALAAEVANG